MTSPTDLGIVSPRVQRSANQIAQGFFAAQKLRANDPARFGGEGGVSAANLKRARAIHKALRTDASPAK